MGCKKVDLRTYLIFIKPLSMHPNLLDDLLKYQLLVPTLVWSCWGRGDLAFLTSSQVIAMLLACGDHFENHCPKITLWDPKLDGRGGPLLTDTESHSLSTLTAC